MDIILLNVKIYWHKLYNAPAKFQTTLLLDGFNSNVAKIKNKKQNSSLYSLRWFSAFDIFLTLILVYGTNKSNDIKREVSLMSLMMHSWQFEYVAHIIWLF